MIERNAESLAEELLAWPMSDRARLAELLIASLEPTESNCEGAWGEEINRRAAEFDSGKVEGIPSTEVFAEIDRRLRR